MLEIHLFEISIPSFRHLIEIERLNWSEFKKVLSTKNDKEAFNTMFENAKLYTQYLSNSNRPIPIEPIMMGALFHNYKTLLKLCKDEDNTTEDSINQKLVVLDRDKPLAKALFDKTCERWRGLLYALHKDDREQLLKMLVDCCVSLDDEAAKVLIDKVSESNISILFFFCLVLQNQKLIERIKNSVKNGENIKTNGTLFDYID
ncbi:hypothetical protein [Candidatus Nitrosocosmicus sp. R]